MPYIYKSCGVCGKEFRTTTSKVSIGCGKFCSRKCYYDLHPSTPEKRKEQRRRATRLNLERHPEVVKESRRKYNASDHGKARAREYERLYYLKHPEKVKAKNARTQRARSLKYSYGISIEQFDQMSDMQDGRCAICLIKPDKLVIDHDHITGKFRGLLCRHCNVALGLFRENTGFLLSAVQYLESHSISSK